MMKERTHYDGCWNEHLECAMSKIYHLQSLYEQEKMFKESHQHAAQGYEEQIKKLETQKTELMRWLKEQKARYESTDWDRCALPIEDAIRDTAMERSFEAVLNKLDSQSSEVPANTHSKVCICAWDYNEDVLLKSHDCSIHGDKTRP